MAQSCSPADVMAGAKCFMCLDQKQREAIMVYLLAVIAGVSLDPATLMKNAACFNCLNDRQAKILVPYLLCQINSGATV